MDSCISGIVSGPKLVFSLGLDVRALGGLFLLPVGAQRLCPESAAAHLRPPIGF